MTDAYNPATRPCAHGPTSGITSLQHSILGYWTTGTNLGTFICRPTADGAPSVHGNGRAGDVGPGKDPCTEIADWLVANHTTLGVQLVIWNHRIWNVSRASEGWRPYGCDVAGSKKDHHTGHVHYEINVDAGRRLTPGIIDPVLPHAPHPDPEPSPTPEVPDMDFFILNDNNTGTQDQWYWWPELGGEKGTKAIIPGYPVQGSSAIVVAEGSRRFCGHLYFDRPDLDAIPTLRPS